MNRKLLVVAAAAVAVVGGWLALFGSGSAFRQGHPPLRTAAAIVSLRVGSADTFVVEGRTLAYCSERDLDRWLKARGLGWSHNGDKGNSITDGRDKQLAEVFPEHLTARCHAISLPKRSKGWADLRGSNS